MSERRGSDASGFVPPVVLVTIGIITVILASAVTIGADAMWLVAMGREIARGAGVPIGVPFATADSAAWVNVPVLGELAFAGVHALGPSALPLAQIVVDVALLLLLAVGARRNGAGGAATASVLLIVAVGSLPGLGVVRSQTMSLLPYALLLLLLRAENREPTRRIWLVVPLLAFWGNLHGAVLVGVALTLCYLALSRFRKQPAVALGVGVASTAAVWATPGGLDTGEYYLGVLTNEAARRGSQLWAPLSIDDAADLLLVAAAIILIAFFVVARPPLWELVTAAGLTAGTVSASRHGIWLVLFLAAPAARGLTTAAAQWRPRRASGALSAPLVSGVGMALLVLAASLALTRDHGVSTSRIASSVSQHAGASAVLATEPLVESLAAENVKVWMSNPIDAFSRSDQVAYLDFLEGRGAPTAVPDSVRVAVVPVGSAPAVWALSAGFTPAEVLDGYQIMTR